MRSNDSWLWTQARPLGVFAALTLGPGTVLAQPVGPDTTPQTTAPPSAVVQPTGPAASEPPPPTTEPTVQPTTQPTTTTTTTTQASGSAPVDDAAWEALNGRQVAVETQQGPVQGELLRSQGDTLVLVRDDGEVVTVPKSEALRVRMIKPAAGSPTPTPAPASEPSAAQQMAELDGGPSTRSAEPEPDASPEATQDPEEQPEELSPAQQRRKERREKREHALLGAFMMHGATYSHWRGDGIQSGGASYAMDWGLGLNLSPSFGMYAMAGGLLGAKIDNKRTKANYGHVAFVFAFSRKYFFSTVGLGGAFSRLRYHTTVLERDRGLAIPTRLVGKIPLPKKMYLGIGLTYELGIVRGFSRYINGIGGQIVVGRW